jgi:hypothetical protein
MPPRMLLNSRAMPPANVPRISIFCAGCGVIAELRKGVVTETCRAVCSWHSISPVMLIGTLQQSGCGRSPLPALFARYLGARLAPQSDRPDTRSGAVSCADKSPGGLNVAECLRHSDPRVRFVSSRRVVHRQTRHPAPAMRAPHRLPRAAAIATPEPTSRRDHTVRRSRRSHRRSESRVRPRAVIRGFRGNRTQGIEGVSSNASAA